MNPFYHITITVRKTFYIRFFSLTNSERKTKTHFCKNKCLPSSVIKSDTKLVWSHLGILARVKVLVNSV